MKKRQRGFLLNPFRFAGPATDPLIALVKFGVNFTGTNGQTSATDYATGKAITFVGGAHITTSTSTFSAGSCLDISITNHGTLGASWLTVPDSADWTPGASEDFCWEVVIDGQGGTGGTMDIVNHSTGSSAYPYRFYRSSANALGLLGFDNATSLDWNTVGGAITSGFKHLAFRRVGSTVYLSIDGVTVNTISSASAARFNSTGELNIGMYNGLTSGTGYIQSIRYTKGDGRYGTGSFTPPSALFPTS